MSGNRTLKIRLRRVDHIEMSTGVRFNCEECGLLLPRRAKESDLKRHLRTTHVERRERYRISNEAWAEHKRTSTAEGRNHSSSQRSEFVSDREKTCRRRSDLWNAVLGIIDKRSPRYSRQVKQSASVVEGALTTPSLP